MTHIDSCDILKPTKVNEVHFEDSMGASQQNIAYPDNGHESIYGSAVGSNVLHITPRFRFEHVQESGPTQAPLPCTTASSYSEKRSQKS